MALYPEKYIFDVGGLPKILAKDLANNMIEQGTQFGPEVVLEAEVQELVHEDGHIRLVTAGRLPDAHGGDHRGQGRAEPAGAGVPGLGGALRGGAGVHTHVHQPEDFRGKRVLLVGGGDSAVDWALGLQGIAREITLIHRRDQFRAHKASVEQMRAGRGRASSTSSPRTRCARSRATAAACARPTVYHNETGEDRAGGGRGDRAARLQAGPRPDRRWGLELERTPSRSRR
jgi:ferredoxin/flavodoxin---NADP+ reductase